MSESERKSPGNLSDSGPLAGKNVLITRPRAQAAQLQQILLDLGATVLEAPVIRTVDPPDWQPVDQALKKMDSYDWLVFTSANGVDAAAGRLDLLGISPGRIAAVDTATAAAVEHRFGRPADLVPKQAVGQALGEELIRDHDIRNKRLLLLRADIASQELPEMLQQAGAAVTDLTAYQTEPVDLLPEQAIASLRAGTIDWITFTSASTVRSMVRLLGNESSLLAQMNIASIGPITSAAVQDLGFEVAAEADPSDVPALADAMVRAAR